MKQENLWFIRDESLQAGVIHLWAPRFADFSYWVSKNIFILRYLFWELQKKNISQ